MFTGGLENWPRLVGQLATLGPLWGNDEKVLSQVRRPELVRDVVFCQWGTAAPALSTQPPRDSGKTRWLVKPRRGAGGTGIHFLEQTHRDRQSRGKVYYQEYIEGESYAVLYTGDGRLAHWHGVTRQLVGESWLNAAAFHYCGSLGPVSFKDIFLSDALAEMGDQLAARFRLRGLFGVDGVVRDHFFYAVEVNPRYTASVEVLEYAQNWPALTFHREGCGMAEQKCSWKAPPQNLCVGKAILFARQPLEFPASGPWEGELQDPTDIHQVPAFADIPHLGERIDAGRPVLTFFAQAKTEAACLDTLKQIARELNGWLFGSP